MEDNTIDNSIIAGLGISNNFNLSLEDLQEPAATSTGNRLKSRGQVLNNFLDEYRDYFSKIKIEEVPDISPAKTFEERLYSVKKKLPKLGNKDIGNQQISSENSSFIDVNEMSYLSTSSFLLNDSEIDRDKESQKNMKKNTYSCGLPSIMLLGNTNNASISKDKTSVDPWEMSHNISTTSNYFAKESSKEFEDDKSIDFSLNQISASSSMISNACQATGEAGKSVHNSQIVNSMLEENENLTFEKDCTLSNSYFDDKSDFLYKSHSFQTFKDFSECDIKDLTVRSSWLNNLKCDNLKVGDKINVNEYFENFSCPDQRPSFGYGGCESPPKPNKFDSPSYLQENSPEDMQAKLHDSSYTRHDGSSQVYLASNEPPLLNKLYERGTGDGGEEEKPVCPTTLDLDKNLSLDEVRKLLMNSTKDSSQMLKRVLKLAHGNNSADEYSSIVDTSYEVLELRKIRERRSQELENRISQSSKENVSNASNANPTGNVNSNYNTYPTTYKSTYSNKENVNPYSHNSVNYEQLNTDHMSQLYQHKSSASKRPARFKMGTSSLQSNHQGSRTLQDNQQMHSPRPSDQQVPLSVPVSKNLDTVDKIFGIPSELHFPKPCITEIKSETSIQINNPTKKHLNIAVKDLEESLNGQQLSLNFLHFKNNVFIQAKSIITFTFGICSFNPGMYNAKLTLMINDLDGQIIYQKKIILHAHVIRPQVEILCEGSHIIDFGIVPEGCLFCKEVTIINHSQQSVPVFLKLEQLKTTGDVLYWCETNKHLKLLSPSLAACELPARKDPLVVVIMFRCPSLENMSGGKDCLMVDVASLLTITLDNPFSNNCNIKEVPIKAQIGEICIRTSKKEIPLVLKAKSLTEVSSDFSFLNKSLFPLNMKFSLSNSQICSVSPKMMIVRPDDEGKIFVTFYPHKVPHQIKEIDELLKVGIEPDGMEFDVPIKCVVDITDNFAPMKYYKKSALLEVPKSELKRSNSQLLKEVSKPEIRRCNSNPIPVKLNQELSLESNKARIVFGCVNVGEEALQKLTLYNCWNSENLILDLCLQGDGSEDFSFSEGPNGTKTKNKEICILPQGEIVIYIYFEPSAIRSYSSHLISQTKQLVKNVKSTFSVQGYGGSGTLTFLDLKEEKLSFNEMVPGNSTVIDTTVKNTGNRTLFVKMRILSSLREEIMQSDIKIFPDEFILKSEESMTILVVAFVNASLISKCPSNLGILQAIYGNEILRTRFRRCKSRQVKRKKITDLSLLKINWDTSFVSENDFIEKDDLPLQPEDVALFFNECKIITVPLFGFVDFDSEESSTRCIIVPEITISSIQPSNYTDEQISRDQRNFETRQIGKGIRPNYLKQDFEVFPHILKFTIQSLEQEVSAVSHNDCDQEIEVSNNNTWLVVEPRESVLRAQSFIVFKFKIQPTLLPSPLPSILKKQVEILGDNTRCIVDIHLNINAGDLQRLLQANSNRIPGKLQAVTGHRDASRIFDQNSGRFLGREQPVESKVSLASDHLEFPIVKCRTKYGLKITLRNMDNVSHEIKASLESDHFMIRHTSFEIKSGHHVNLPVFFVPQCVGVLRAHLSLIVVKDSKHFRVTLTGEAVESV